MENKKTSATTRRKPQETGADRFASSVGIKEQNSFIKKAESLVSRINESRNIPISIIKEPFNV